MTRKTIFEILDGEICYFDEIDSIEALFCAKCALPSTPDNKTNRRTPIFKDMVNRKFLRWEHRGTANDMNDFICRCGLGKLTDVFRKETCSQEEFITYCEAMYNMALIGMNGHEINSFKEIGRAICKNIIIVLNKIGYTIYEYPNEIKAIAIVNNDKAVIAANNVEKDSAKRIMEYNHFILKGNLSKKKDILKNLADLYEGNKKKLNENNMKQLSSDIGFLLNKLNIRHNNEKDNKSNNVLQKIPPKELEEWYDKTYELILTSIMDLKKLETMEEIKTLKCSLDDD